MNFGYGTYKIINLWKWNC